MKIEKMRNMVTFHRMSCICRQKKIYKICTGSNYEFTDPFVIHQNLQNVLKSIETSK